MSDQETIDLQQMLHSDEGNWDGQRKTCGRIELKGAFFLLQEYAQV